ncbi:MAG: hypothetical protein CGW95_16845, partial [Phenylobacterium zucineum]
GPPTPAPQPKPRKYYPSHVFGPEPFPSLTESTLPVDPDFDHSWRKGRVYGRYTAELAKDPSRALFTTGVTSAGGTSSLTISSLNINGLTAPKLTEVTWYIQHFAVDVLILVDTRCGSRQSKHLAHQARRQMGIGSGAHYQAATAGLPTRRNPRQRASLVGGMMFLLSPRWASRTRQFIADPTDLGVVAGIALARPEGDILIFGTYWPCPPSSAESMGLWNKLQQWLHRINCTINPIKYIRGVLQGRVTRHLGSRSPSVTSPMAVVAGDFNASWDDRHGPHRGLADWARATGLVNPGATLDPNSPPPATFYSGLRSIGAIDNILLSSSCPGVVTKAAVVDGSFWSTITDHRPPILGIHLGPAAVAAITGQRARPSFPRVEAPAVAAARTAYQTRLSTLLPDSPCSSSETASEFLFSVSLRSADWAAALLPASNARPRRWKDGWSPTMICL